MTEANRQDASQLIKEFVESLTDPMARELIEGYADEMTFATLDAAFDVCLKRRLAEGSAECASDH